MRFHPSISGEAVVLHRRCKQLPNAVHTSGESDELVPLESRVRGMGWVVGHGSSTSRPKTGQGEPNQRAIDQKPLKVH